MFTKLALLSRSFALLISLALGCGTMAKSAKPEPSSELTREIEQLAAQLPMEPAKSWEWEKPFVEGFKAYRQCVAKHGIERTAEAVVDRVGEVDERTAFYLLLSSGEATALLRGTLPSIEGVDGAMPAETEYDRYLKQLDSERMVFGRYLRMALVSDPRTLERYYRFALWSRTMVIDTRVGTFQVFAGKIANSFARAASDDELNWLVRDGILLAHAFSLPTVHEDQALQDQAKAVRRMCTEIRRLEDATVSRLHWNQATMQWSHEPGPEKLPAAKEDVHEGLTPFAGCRGELPEYQDLLLYSEKQARRGLVTGRTENGDQK